MRQEGLNRHVLNLNNANLNALAPEVSAPTYDRTQRRSGIAHVGVGHFHRSHQAMYVDRLRRAGSALDWAICGVGVLPNDSKSRDILREQDYLYTLTVEEADGTKENAGSRHVPWDPAPAGLLRNRQPSH